MILKAAAAGVPVLVTRSIPTTTAFEIAQETGISLVGRIGDRQPIVYTCPERIRLS
jgi:FdhD protein